MELRENMDWPPTAAEVARSVNEWDAWWSGNRGRLSSLYAGQNVRPSQFNGGIVGWGSRMLWGTPPRGEFDNRIHLPLAADIAAASADLLFGEELTYNWGEDAARGERMEQVLDAVNWQSLLAEAGETAAALGGVYLRAGWDQTLADHPLATVVAPDGAYTEFSFGIPRSILFWFTYTRGGTTYRHTELHEPGTIRHQLWKGSGPQLGTLVPLDEIPETAGLAEVVDQEDIVYTGTDALTAVYVPNMRPVPQWRKAPGAQYLGRSDFGVEGVLGIFDAIDEAWTSWMRDLRHGRSRIFATQQALVSDAPGKGAYMDLDREVYEVIKVPFGDNPTVENMVVAQQFQIRVEEHRTTIRELTLAALSACGYSGSTFGLDTEVAKTATEVGAVRGRTAATRKKKTRYWTHPLEDFLYVLSELDRAVFGRPGYAPDERPRVSFPPFDSPSLLDLAQTAQALKAAEAASTETLVRLIHPDWDDQEVDEEAARIKGDAPEPLEIGAPFAPDDITEE